MNDENTLIDLGFTHYPEWDFKSTGTKAYRLEAEGMIFRAHVNDTVKPIYVTLGVVIRPNGIIDRWRDCVSKGSVERKITEILKSDTWKTQTSL